MNKYARLIRLFVLVGLCLVCAGGMQLCSYGYLPWERVPDRSFPVEVLLIDESVFPPGATAGPVMPNPDSHGAVEHAGRSIYVGTGGANYEAYRYESLRQAAREYRRQMRVWFSEGEGWTPWLVPSEVSYQSPIADQYYLACGSHYSVSMCNMIGQYEEYFVRFNSHISPDFMTYADLERVLKAIDERMALYLAEDSE